MNPYLTFVKNYVAQLKAARALPLGGIEPVARAPLIRGAAKVLIFSPHPDDECIVGGLALRLLKEGAAGIVNVAVTQGSKKERQAARLAELQQACACLGFGLRTTVPGGLAAVTAKTRENNKEQWAGSVEVIARILEEERPQIIFMPHALDNNGTHIGTHFLVVDALERLSPAFECYVVETEFWGAMTSPNLMVECNEEEVAELIAALSFHKGEVERNPYHIGLPAWLQDNVRRGAELVGGQGGAAPEMTFATLYRLRKFSAGGLKDFVAKGQFVTSKQKAGDLFKI